MTNNQILIGRRISLMTPLAIGVAITLLLFYIDEGYYSFKWMLSIGNWVIFCVYAGIIFAGQLLVQLPAVYLLPERLKFKQAWLTIPGLVLAAMLLYAVFW